MALRKAVAAGIEPVADYWRLRSRLDDFMVGCTDVTLAGYASEETRRRGDAPLPGATLAYRFDQRDMPVGKSLDQLTRADLYGLVKDRANAGPPAGSALADPLAGAGDVLEQQHDEAATTIASLGNTAPPNAEPAAMPEPVHEESPGVADPVDHHA